MAEALTRCGETLAVERDGEVVHVRCCLPKGAHVRHDGLWRPDAGRVVEARWGGNNATIVSLGWRPAKVPRVG